jgi:hypothetical protein
MFTTRRTATRHRVTEWTHTAVGQRQNAQVPTRSRQDSASFALASKLHPPSKAAAAAFNRLWTVCGCLLFTDRGRGSIWPAATGPGLLGLDRPHQPDPAGLAPASSSRSIGRRADARSLRSARESLFRSREARNCRRQQDPRPRRGVARSCSRPDDRSEVHQPGSWGSVRRPIQRMT